MSIYNENFTTPESREPYFIKVHRCIKACWTGRSIDMPIALTQTEIEIVVADINNQTKFYKYVVYNHTRCGCHNVTQINKLHKTDLVSNEGKHLFQPWPIEGEMAVKLIRITI